MQNPVSLSKLRQARDSLFFLSNFSNHHVDFNMESASRSVVPTGLISSKRLPRSVIEKGDHLDEIYSQKLPCGYIRENACLITIQTLPWKGSWHMNDQKPLDSTGEAS